jgi:hypothetical protein
MIAHTATELATHDIMLLILMDLSGIIIIVSAAIGR